MENPKALKIFLNKLKWKAATKEFNEMAQLQIDVYCFKFKTPIIDPLLTEFLELMEQLNMRRVRSLMIVFVWLYQKKIQFRLGFRWCPHVPISYNLKNVFAPLRMKRQLLADGEAAIMECPLDYMIKRTIELEKMEGEVRDNAENCI